MPISSQEIVIFDQDCALCRQLAAFVKKRMPQRVGVISWQEFLSNLPAGLKRADLPETADELRVWNGQELLSKEDAWSYLLENYADLRSLNWLAERLGLRRQLAGVMRFVGHAARLTCWNCR